MTKEMLDRSARKSTGPAGITRRDFIHDLSLSTLGLSISGFNLAATASDDAALDRYYPPTRTGLRGSHPGAFEQAHALARQGKVFAEAKSLDEHYDLVVVGAGISGLAAAHFYREKYGQNARILLLDNHDDFGGHAKRNEFHQTGNMRLAWGGTVNIEYHNYSEVGKKLLSDLGVDVPRLLENFEFNWGNNDTGLDVATWFDRETYGRDALLPGISFLSLDREALLRHVGKFPLTEEARRALTNFLSDTSDALPGKTQEQRQAFARETRYEDFLRNVGKLPTDAVQVFSASTMGIWGVRAEDLSVRECLETGLPGAHRLRLDDSFFVHNTPTSAMFPDGNASIARLLVRQLIPECFPTMETRSDPFSIVSADLDYAQLDVPAAKVRLRLSSTVVEARNADDDGVEVRYARDGEVFKVTADRCVMACYNRIIPHICPQLPDVQKAALSQCVKRPMLVVNVLLTNTGAIERSGIANAYLPGSFLQLATVVSGIHVGGYRSDWDSQEPCVLQFFAAMPAEAAHGLSIVEQSQAARARLLQMEFADFEREVNRVLTGVWGASGMDPARDVAAITVNRWPHGYARDLLDLEDPGWLASPGPYEVGRQTFGNIAIANSDSGADAYTHTAIDMAWRAIDELPGQAKSG